MSFSRHATFKQLDALRLLLHPTSCTPAELAAAIRAVAALESAIGVALMERSRQDVRLTAAGYAAAHGFAASLEKLRQGVAALQQDATASQAAGAFRFAAPWWANLGQFDRVETVLRQATGRKTIDFGIASSTECCKQVQAGQLDAALVVEPVDIGTSEAIAVGEIEAQVAVPSAHPLALKSSIALSELSALPAFVMFKQGINPEQDRWLRQRYRELGFVPKKIIRVADPGSLLQLVAAGKAAATFNAVMPPTVFPAGVALRPLAPHSEVKGRVLLIKRKEDGLTVSPALLDGLRLLLQRTVHGNLPAG